MRLKNFMCVKVLILVFGGLSLPSFVLPGQVKKPLFDPADYFVSETFALTKKEHGFDGKLVLWRDIKFKAEKSVDDFYSNDADRMAILELLDPSGKIVDEMVLNVACATLKSEKIVKDGNPVFFVTQITEEDHGGQSRDSWVLKMVEGRMRKALAIEKNGPKKRQKEIVVRAFGGSWEFGQWKLVRSEDEKSSDILSWETKSRKSDVVAANQKESDFDTYYERYSFDGHQWVHSSKMLKGYVRGGEKGMPEGWFPDESIFP